MFLITRILKNDVIQNINNTIYESNKRQKTNNLYDKDDHNTKDNDHSHKTDLKTQEICPNRFLMEEDCIHSFLEEFSNKKCFDATCIFLLPSYDIVLCIVQSLLQQNQIYHFLFGIWMDMS